MSKEKCEKILRLLRTTYMIFFSSVLQWHFYCRCNLITISWLCAFLPQQFCWNILKVVLLFLWCWESQSAIGRKSNRLSKRTITFLKFRSGLIHNSGCPVMTCETSLKAMNTILTTVSCISVWRKALWIFFFFVKKKIRVVLDEKWTSFDAKYDSSFLS